MAGKLVQVSEALEDERRELVLRGSDVSKIVKKHGLDDRIFQLNLLNFLEISDASLEELPKGLENLTQLKNLVLRGNILTSVPSTIGQLCALRTLDLSSNNVESLPDTLGELIELYSLDVSNNQLTDLPESVSDLVNLTVLNVSNNKLKSLSQICTHFLAHLSEVIASQNEITVLDHEISELSALKKLDLCNNQLKELPVDLASCSKLKILLLKENPLKDSRLAKLVKQDQALKPILQGIRTRGVKNKNSEDKGGKGKKDQTGKKKGKKTVLKEDVEEVINKVIEVLHFKESESSTEVRITAAVAEVRPFIVCCVVENISLQEERLYKNFIKLQTRLHDGPLCGKRTVATIATHDMRAIQSPLLYDARLPERIQIVPLMKSKPVTADLLMADLMKEADEQRKAQKRNIVSGVHKYLHLIWGHQKYPCLMNKDGQVISFPPITNADLSKISRGTTSLFIEVTSSKDLASCKAVLDELIREMLLMELGVVTSHDEDDSSDSSDSSDSEEGRGRGAVGQQAAKSLRVRQVRIVDEEGSMKVVYPSRTDLNYKGIHVVRH
ncbi:leucine-rich repeat-containing protein 47-like [Apostichopus japonicus]|uniref:leucine-rich repeat-containing protein 47-like n=1 Tax=Stichopus japonicus TaxID=307972 RepID=UPI003AB83861